MYLSRPGFVNVQNWKNSVKKLNITIMFPFYNLFKVHSSMTSFFRFANKRAASYPFGIISLAHAPVNVTDFSIDSINCVRHFPQT
jgi:hypothetical protein